MLIHERREKNDLRCGRRKHLIAWRQNVGQKFCTVNIKTGLSLFSVINWRCGARARDIRVAHREQKMKRRPRDHSLHVNLGVCRVQLEYVGVGLRARSRSLRAPIAPNDHVLKRKRRRKQNDKNKMCRKISLIGW